jgi:hypothetical protein
MIALVLLYVMGTAVVLFVLEVIALLAGAERARPSAVLSNLAWARTQANYYGAYLLMRMTNIGYLLKKLALLVRDLFFRFVPRAIILRAYRDLGASLGACARVYEGIGEGMAAGLVHVRHPAAVALLSVVAVAALPVAVDLVLLTAGVPWRVSVLSTRAADVLYAVGYDVLDTLLSCVELGRLVATLLAPIFGWLRIEEVREVAREVYAGLASMATAPFRGAVAGLCATIARPEHVGMCRASPVAMLLANIPLVGGAGMLANLAVRRYHRPSAVAVVPGAEPDGDNDDDNDDDARPNTPARRVTRAAEAARAEERRQVSQALYDRLEKSDD